MRSSKLTFAITVAALAIAGATAVGDDYKGANRRDIDDSVHAIDKDIRRNHSQNDALHVISVETGVPQGKLQEILDHRPNAGLASVMMACTIADYTKRDPNYYLDQHRNVSWQRLLADAGVPPEKVNHHLTRLEEYSRSAPEHPRVERR